MFNAEETYVSSALKLLNCLAAPVQSLMKAAEAVISEEYTFVTHSMNN